MKKVIDPKQLLFENMKKLNPDFKEKEVVDEKKVIITEDDKWIQKAVEPSHKGYCTPMTKPTCTPRRKALAKRFKKGIEDEAYGTPDPFGTNMAKQISEGIPMEINPEEIKIKAERIKAAIDAIVDDDNNYGVLETLYRLLVERKKPIKSPEQVTEIVNELKEHGYE